jgi:hypothetical protein
VAIAADRRTAGEDFASRLVEPNLSGAGGPVYAFAALLQTKGSGEWECQGVLLLHGTVLFGIDFAPGGGQNFNRSKKSVREK